MTWTQFLGVLCFALPVAWSAYEAYRMRRSRLKTDLLMSVTACCVENLDKRLTLAVQNDQAIAAKIAELSRPQNPA
jgi:hypothetical protein